MCDLIWQFNSELFYIKTGKNRSKIIVYWDVEYVWGDRQFLKGDKLVLCLCSCETNWINNQLCLYKK